MSEFKPSLPYAGTAGFVDVDTSRESAYREVTEGITAKSQKYVLILLSQVGTRGYTVAELREKSGALHHGRVSGALTSLHKAGRIVALRERRNGCGVYVLPSHVAGREVRAFHPNRAVTIERGELIDLIDDWITTPDAGEVDWVEALADAIIAKWSK